MSTSETGPAFGEALEPFVVHGAQYDATVVPISEVEARVRVVPPFTPGESVLADGSRSSLVMIHHATTEKATVLDITSVDGELNPGEVQHTVGSLVMDLDQHQQGTGIWEVPGSITRYTPATAMGTNPL